MEIYKQNANLDLMRSMAVIFVLFSHLHVFFFQSHAIDYWRPAGLDLFKLGYWAVLIFFVHTSFVLMYSLERMRLSDSSPSLWPRFMLQRIFRIYPLAIVTVLATAILSLPAFLVDGRFVPAHLTPFGLMSNLLLIQNVVHTDSLSGPLWSLPYEMDIYLFLPVLFLIVRAKRTPAIAFLMWFAAVVLAACLYNMHVPARFHIGMWPGYPDLLIFAPCFLAGVAAYSLSKRLTLTLPAFLWPCFVVILTFIYLGRPGFKAGWVCCLALGCAIPQFREISNQLLKRIFQWIARYSYGVYLTHFMLIWLAFQVLHFLPMWLRWAVFTGSVVALPVILYHAVEEPLIRVGKRIAGDGFRLAILREAAPASGLIASTNAQSS